MTGVALGMVGERFSATISRFRTYDRPLLIMAGLLIGLGILFSMSTSPVAHERIGASTAFLLAARQAIYAAVGLVVIFTVAAFDPRTLRRGAVILAAVMFFLCVLVSLVTPEMKGASRWFDLGPVSLQPSELLKPALVVVWAWMLGQSMKNSRFPGRIISLGLYALAAGALLMQPDIGQTALLGIVLSAMLILSGVALRWVAGGGVAMAAAAYAIYRFYPHARDRVDQFLHPEGDKHYQVARALDAIASGGVFGRGPGEGIVKRSLPDAYGDFVYAVAAEEFGLIASIGVIVLFFCFAFRGLSRASRLNEPFEQLAAAGLVTLLVVQACIHIAVNMSMIPAKGMTLPFISFGGSSMIGSALALGFCLSLLRDRPGAYLYARRP